MVAGRLEKQGNKAGTLRTLNPLKLIPFSCKFYTERKKVSSGLKLELSWVFVHLRSSTQTTKKSIEMFV